MTSDFTLHFIKWRGVDAIDGHVAWRVKFIDETATFRACQASDTVRRTEDIVSHRTTFIDKILKLIVDSITRAVEDLGGPCFLLRRLSLGQTLCWPRIFRRGLPRPLPLGRGWLDKQSSRQ